MYTNLPVFIFNRCSLLSLASTSESFLLLRCTFIQSLSVINICQYILGIGDRHLSNFMVDMETGQLVGIDFGHAFHSATQVRLYEFPIKNF